MSPSTPHYLLYCRSGDRDEPGRWWFVLRTTNGLGQHEARDVEPKIRGERLELLTLVRGLEALDQPSRVTLMTASRYVREGIRYGLPQWRGNGWRWELFGEMVPLKNRDLWQRIDRAMQFHQVECRSWRIDPPHEPVTAPDWGRKRCPAIRIASRNGPGSGGVQLSVGGGRWLAAMLGRCKRGLRHALATLVPSPRFG